MEKEEEKRWFLQWVVQLPYMTKEKFMSFDAYKRKVSGADLDLRPASVIEREIEKAFEEQRKEEMDHGNGDF